MTKIFTRWLPCATLASWSAILLYFYFSGHIHALLHPAFRPYTLIAGILLALLAACFAFLPVSLEPCADDVSGKSFGRKATGRVLTFLILLAPICAAAAFSNNSYGLSTVLNRGVVDDAQGLTKTQVKSTPYVEPALPSNDNSQPDQSQAAAQPQSQASSSQPPPPEDDQIPRSKDGNIIVQVVDLLYAAQDPSMRGDFKNQNIEMIGQLMPDTSNNINGKRFKLVRMFMVCCAADARPVAVVVESDTKPQGADMSWIKIVGTVDFPVENGRPVAIVKAAKVIATDPPEETMLY
jgi:uncharacterized repeat protein (TIGR03943 family)